MQLVELPCLAGAPAINTIGNDMRIPDIADRMRVLADEHHIGELRLLADELRRRPSVRTPRKSTSVTPWLRQAIRRIKGARPDLSHQQIGTMCNVNAGRVSEALRGKRR